MSTSSGTILYHMLPTDAWSLPAQPGNPTLTLGVKESRKVLEPILDVKKRGLPVVLISQKPHVFEVADRFNIRSRSSTPGVARARRRRTSNQRQVRINQRRRENNVRTRTRYRSELL
jgi:ABC-type sugar transport system ATPase subunit